MACQFCMTPEKSFIVRSYYWFAILPQVSVSKGHLLIIPNQHFKGMSQLYSQERSNLSLALRKARIYLDENFQPQGYKIGVNCGQAAEQIVEHLQLHIIPRYTEDVEDPREGMGNLIKPLPELLPELY